MSVLTLDPYDSKLGLFPTMETLFILNRPLQGLDEREVS